MTTALSVSSSTKNRNPQTRVVMEYHTYQFALDRWKALAFDWDVNVVAVQVPTLHLPCAWRCERLGSPRSS